MTEAAISSPLKMVPTLTGTDSFVDWRRAITAYLNDAGSLRVLHGKEKEPFRRAINPNELGDASILYPSGDWAGLEPPNASQSTTEAALTPTQRAAWENWEKKERKARSAIMLTVSRGIATDIEDLWSAHDMFTHIQAEHRIDTTQHRGNIIWRLQALHLERGATPDQLLSHFEAFTGLLSEAKAAGLVIDDWEKCEKFILTFNKDIDLIRLQFRVMPPTERTWKTLVTEYKSFVDTQRMEQQRDRDATVAAIFPKSSRPPKPPRPATGGKPISRNRDKKTDFDGGKGKPKPKCSWCGIPGHKEVDCRKKQSGEPSKAQITEAVKQIKDKGSINHVNASSWLGGGDAFGGETYHVSAVDSPPPANSVQFLIDSGASHHLVSDRTLLTGIEPVATVTFGLAGSGSLSSTERGYLVINRKGIPPAKIEDVYYVPGVRLNILSVTKLRSSGWKTDFNSHVLSIGANAFRITSTGLPRVSFGLPRPRTVSPPLGNAYAVPQVDSPLYSEHVRLGHIGRDQIIDLAKGGQLRYSLEDLKQDDFKLSDCKLCLSATSKKQPKNGESPRGSVNGEMVHVDLTGRLTPSVDGFEYALIMYADYTKVRAAIPIRLKSDAAALIPSFIARLEKQSGIKVKVIRSDLGSEFSIKSYCDRTGVIHQTTPGYAPELNGVAERSVGLIKTRALLLTLSTPLGHPYWSYAMRYAAVIYNKITQSGIEGKSAWQVITGRETNLDAIREYGEVCFAHIPPELRIKSSLDAPKARQARILGIDEAITGYIIRYEDDGSIGRSRDVRTATGLPLSTPLKVTTPVPSRSIPIKPVTIQQAPQPVIPPVPHQPAVINPPIQETVPQGTGELTPAQPELQESTIETPAHPSPAPTPKKVRFAPTKPTRRSARINHPTGEYTGPNARTAHLASESALVLAITPTANEPKSIAEAMSRPDAALWSAAIAAELDNLTGKGTWEETTLPPGRKAIGCKWVLKTKTDADGKVVKHKARLVAQGFSQQPGIDFEETFAPVGRSTSLRILLTLAAAHDLEVHQADVEGAYLNGELDRELYMRLPAAYELQDQSCNALRLKKTLYGLKQSGREWWKVLGDALKELGFSRCENEWGMYILSNQDGSPRVLLLAYVDDLVLAARETSDIDTVLSSLAKRWVISRLGPVTHILGSKVTRDRSNKVLWMTQTAYIDSLMERFPGYSTTIAKNAPLPLRGTTDDVDQPAALSPYQELAGCLLWLAGFTRPDISYAASYLSRFTVSPTESHLQLALRVVSYLVHTRTLGITLGGKTRPLEMYVDADWAGCEATRRSTTGYLAMLYGSPINWCSRRQQTTAASTMEAEYIAGAEATKDIVWLRNLLQELGLPQPGPTHLFCDNQAAIRLTGNPSTHARSKHIDIKHHIMRERVETGDIEVKYLETSKQRADCLTKPLGGPRHAVAMKELRLGAPRVVL